MIFYAPDCTKNNDTYILSEVESKHCIKVLRKKNGNEIEIINGKGGQFICQIIDDNEKRLQKITISALKQSKRFHLPVIDESVAFKDFIKANPKGYIGHCNSIEKIHAKKMNKPMPFLIGPEGDFSNTEISQAIDLGYISVELSENRLRTETAALTSVFYLSNLLV